MYDIKHYHLYILISQSLLSISYKKNCLGSEDLIKIDFQYHLAFLAKKYIKPFFPNIIALQISNVDLLLFKMGFKYWNSITILVCYGI